MKTLKIKTLSKLVFNVFILTFSAIIISCNDDDGNTVVNPPVTNFDYQNEKAEAIVVNETIKDSDNFSEDLEIEFYNVQNSSDKERPLVLLSSGGGFKTHNEIEKMHEYALSLAKRGYASAVVKYAINGTGNNADIWIRALQDMKTAIRYFKHNAAIHEIDPDNIFTYGWSTGAQLGFYASFLSVEEYDAFQQDFLKDYIKKGLEWHGWDSGAFPNENTSVKATIMCMPYMFDEQIIGSDDPALMLIANESQVFSNGDIIMGRLNSIGIWNLGPDRMRDQALSAGYVEGENLVVDIFSNEGIPGNMTNESAIYEEYYSFENVVQFIYSNL